MTYRDIAKAQLRADEGDVAHAYQDSLGFWTIGVGHLIDKRLGGGLSQRIRDLILEEDMDRDEATARKLFPTFDSLSDARKAVLLNMAHQLGEERLAAFMRFREAVSEERWQDAAAEMKDSRWYEQTPARVERLIRQMMEG